MLTDESCSSQRNERYSSRLFVSAEVLVNRAGDLFIVTFLLIAGTPNILKGIRRLMHPCHTVTSQALAGLIFLLFTKTMIEHSCI